MGRKGVSKRKSKTTKSKPFSGKTAGGSDSSPMMAAEIHPFKPLDSGKDAPSGKSGAKKNPRKS